VWSKNGFLCIIHDKMDHVKIALPRLQAANKIICGLGQLPIALTGIIAHGHGDERLCNILMNFGLMIPILQLGHCCNFFKVWRKL